MTQLCSRSGAVFRQSTLAPSRSNSRALQPRCHRMHVRAQASGNSDLFFVAHNNFKVKKEGCQQFEETWKNRESHLKETPGFVRFALLRGDEEGDYISQSTWATRQDFQNWTQSQNFAKAHGQGSQDKKPEQEKKPEHGGSKRAGMAELLDGPPKPRFYEAVTVTEK